MGSLTGKPDLTVATTIHNDGFWPAISVNELLDKYRIPSEYDNAVISHALQLAVVKTNQYVVGLKFILLNNGYSTLVQAAQAQLINLDISAQLHYQNAVYSRAKAMLLQQFNTMNRRPNAENAAKTGDEIYGYFLDDAALSVQLLIEMFNAPPVTNGNYGNGFYVGLI